MHIHKKNRNKKNLPQVTKTIGSGIIKLSIIAKNPSEKGNKMRKETFVMSLAVLGLWGCADEAYGS